MGDEIRKSDGTPATPEEFSFALYEVGKAKDWQLDCPQVDCDGRIEASCGIHWNFAAGLVPMPTLHSITWAEGGGIICSQGGPEHIPPQLERTLWETMRQAAAALERQLGASSCDDDSPGTLTRIYADEPEVETVAQVVTDAEFTVGDYVSTEFRGLRGRVTQVHGSCPENADWLAMQSAPLSDDERAGRGLWVSILLSPTGAVVIPISDVRHIEPFPFRNPAGEKYFGEEGAA